MKKLSSTFNAISFKDIFPYNFVNKDNLNYVGEVPSIKYFDNISLNEYNEYKSKFNNNWSLKDETIKYCELDCKALHEAISKFAENIFNSFKVNVSTTPTLPSVAMKTYRTNFIPEGIKIAKIGGKMFEDIHKAFYGGHVDLYIPTNPIGTKVYAYDVNSLYAYVMKIFKYPYQFIGHFYGDISKMKQYFDLYHKCVGFYKVKVTAPKDILHPILSKKVNNTTVYGIGSWTGWYYSEELKNAALYGYTFEIIEGYLFKTADLFSKYVDTLYHLKETSAKNSPMYMIAKLLLNALFGKFSMKRELINYAVIDKYGVDKFIESIGFDKFIKSDEIGGMCLVSYKLQYQDDLNINIAVGAAITANARIYMSQFKNNPNYNLYYTDTDSVFVNKPLADHLIDNKMLGLLKLEHVLDKFVAIGPKVYGGIDIQANEFTKTKGLKSKLSFNQLETLLNENVSIDIKQEKWFKNLVDSNIIVKDNTSYNLKPTSYKRDLIYQNGVLVGTCNKDISDK
uniref:DNA-directed DNA polymerase n=1 Tax=Fomitiporia mediterranea TaxID=208960 RepID=A0A5B9R9D8_9AGAM|nr:DNA polymerase family B [Fomitiporia mediterranea]QEG57091.1 DNA polymerase family B [Fomitiporia mediterranea]